MHLQVSHSLLVHIVHNPNLIQNLTLSTCLTGEHFVPLRSIETVEDMIKMGVYVNDLNLHDSSRELILAGTQQSAELQLALDQVKRLNT